MAALSCVNTKYPLSEPLHCVTMTERLNRVFDDAQGERANPLTEFSTVD
jgi:hypothetical protein